jgi:hypothetical protein
MKANPQTSPQNPAMAIRIIVLPATEVFSMPHSLGHISTSVGSFSSCPVLVAHHLSASG